MTDLKTIMYSMTPSVSGNFSYTTSANAFDMVQFNNGVNWSIQTTAVEPSDTTGVNLISLGGVNYGLVGSIWYFGKASRFDTFSLQFNSNTDNTGTRTITYEYWNGSTWVALPQSGATATIAAGTGTLNVTNLTLASFRINPLIYSSWATTTVNGSGSLYYIRMTVGTSAFTSATLASTSSFDHSGIQGYPAFTVFTTTDDLAFTDNTLLARSATAAAFTFTANTTGARLYLGSTTNDILGFNSLCSTAGTVGDGVWEFWNGSTWTALSYDINGPLASTSVVNERFFTNNQQTYIFRTQPLSTWATTTVNGVSAYWIRFRVTSNYTVSPIFQLIIPYTPISMSRTVYIPETTNRTIQSAFVKLHMTNQEFTSPSRFVSWGRFGSNAYELVGVGFGDTPQGNFLNIGGKIFSTTANDGVFTDVTTVLSNTTTNDATITNTVNSNVYFCYPNDTRWTKEELYISINPNSTNANAGGVVAWEYWNGSAWTAFTPIPFFGDRNLNGSTQQRSMMIPLLTNWTATTVNSFTGYIFRRRITTIYSQFGGNWSSVYTSIPGFTTINYNNSAESQSFTQYLDLTKLFQGSFTGTSQTFDLKFSGFYSNLFNGTIPQIAGELYITYSADEQNTRIKSVVIPLGTNDNTALTTTLASIGSNEIPQLSTYLPEASKTIRNFYIVVTGNDAYNTSTTTEWKIKVGSSAERICGYTGLGINTILQKMIYVDDSISTASTHDIQMAITSRLNSFRNWSMYAVVTYEYDASTTTRVINSLLLPFHTQDITLPQDDGSNPEMVRKTFFIQEPGTIDNVRMGAYVSFGDGNVPRLSIKDMNDANYKQLVYATPTQMDASLRYNFKMSTTTLSKGLNTIGIDMYGENQNSSTLLSCYYTCGYFVVNYHSDVYSGGLEHHNKTLICLHQNQRFTFGKNFGFNNLSNPLTNWYINDFGIWGEMFCFNSGGTASTNIRYGYENTASTTRRILGVGGGLTDGNEHNHFDAIVSCDIVKKYPNDPGRPIDIFSANSRFITDYGAFSIVGGSQTIATCHDINYTVSGTITGSDGGLIDIMLLDFVTDEILLQTSRTGNGAYSFTWYDDTRDVYVVALESDTKKGVSKQATAGSGFDITLSSTGGNVVTTSYVWG